MAKYYCIYNPLACNKRGKEKAMALKYILTGEELYFQDLSNIMDYKEFLSTVEEDAKIILCGGDGTLNRFCDATADYEFKNEIFYYATGSGNDFLHDIGEDNSNPVKINEYIKNLPKVTVNGKIYRFLNGIGYGIDGYCCEVGDKMRDAGDQKINYAGIAIKGLLFFFKPRNAHVIVDGVDHYYKKVWLAPTMNGRFYGGGMMVAPQQDRKATDGKLSVVVMHGSGKLKTLIVFPSIFKGEHVSHTEMVSVLKGAKITVKFDKPCALQIDGETILNVSEYTAER